jgi:HIV Tat-specific factor 1
VLTYNLSKLADWDDDGPQTTLVGANAKRDKLVVLKHMFTLKELEVPTL